MSLLDDATEVLDCFARSDVERARALSAPDVVLFGTDDGELWLDREAFLVDLEAMRELGLRARWQEPPSVGDGWVAGTAEFTLGDGSTLPVRVTLVFSGGLLVHGHYSVASEEPTGAPTAA